MHPTCASVKMKWKRLDTNTDGGLLIGSVGFALGVFMTSNENESKLSLRCASEYAKTPESVVAERKRRKIIAQRLALRCKWRKKQKAKKLAAGGGSEGATSSA